MRPEKWELAEDFRVRLREFIEALGATHAEVADFSGVLPKQVSEWLAGRQGPTRQRVRLMLNHAPGGPYPVAIFWQDGPRPKDTVNVDHLPFTELKRRDAIPGHPLGTGVVADGETNVQNARRAGNTHGTRPGGEEPQGSPAPEVLREEAVLAATALQRALLRSLEQCEEAHYLRKLLDASVALDRFAKELGGIGFTDIAEQIAKVSQDIRKPPL
jgi:hypothetical protein